MTALITLYRCQHTDLVKWVRETFGLGGNTASHTGGAINPHVLRREAMAQRIRLYRDDCQIDFERVIDTVFETDDVKLARKKMLAVASEMNVTARIVDEVASLYDAPVVRTLADPAATEQLREHAQEIGLDELMQEAHRLTFLCNAVLLWQSQALEPGERPQLTILTPDAFDAIPDPRAPHTRAAGVVIRCAPTSIGGDVAKLPHYEIWDDTYRYLLNAEGHLCAADGTLIDTPEKHGQPRIPGVLWHRRRPVDQLIDARAGRDIVSAHLGCGLLEVMIMQLSKSQGERQPVLRGNLAAVAKNQSMNGEGPIALPPGVEAFMLDSKTESTHYLEVKRDKLTSVAHRYGMSYEQLTYASVPSSAKEWLVRRFKLLELRGEQKRRAYVHERETLTLLGYEVKGMRTDFPEQALPEDAGEKLALVRELMKLGLANPVDFARYLNPDLSEKEALAWIKRNVKRYAWLVKILRALNMPANADADNPGKSPQQNGADGGRAANENADEDDDEAEDEDDSEDEDEAA